MYLRSVHAESSIPLLLQFVRDNPMGILTTAIPSSAYPLLQSSHIPWVLDVPDSPDAPEKGRLRGHMAKQNPQTKAIIDSLTAGRAPSPTSQLQEEVLVLFNGPYHHYVTPKFYTETKPSTGKVVPTWNYAAVQIYGKATIYYDSASPETSAYLSKQIDDLSRHCETGIMGYTGGEKEGPWQVSDAPDRYIEIMKKNIIGIEIVIERLEGKFKMSQEMGKADREGVVDGFNNLGTDVGAGVAQTVKIRGDLKDSI
ncbi:transcriptional regulator PAI 2-type [Lipomyces tetrasporus]|uniref:Transcriptional regulator PAI 2-type n=1 Tax=Lipomyces tetrasporus TaxID=54092 RepID=A0AAD7VWN7_9ASCO|nr:transcriptional regulator PAI 2-type [Lipomyces tetrasporus]KAJ8104411.1 transcriptional regulator PAI 2-type [Lipomyces tetrasporus]